VGEEDIMVNKCPSCGEEIKKNFKFCLNCGYKLTADEQTTTKVESITSSAGPTPKETTTSVPSPQKPIPQQAYEPSYTGSQTQPKKSNMKIIGILGIIIAIIVIIVILFLLIGGGSDSRFVGTWEYSEPTTGMTFGYVFNGDGSLEVTSDYGSFKVGKWRVSGNQLCFEADESFSTVTTGLFEEQCINYSFSSDGRQLTITSSGVPMTFTKK
jgi:hypothetical protein